MRLLSLDQRRSLAWKEFSRAIPPYAILSHTWGTDEVSFADLENGHAKIVFLRRAGTSRWPRLLCSDNA